LANVARPYFPTLVAMGLSHASLVEFLQEQWQVYVKNGSSLLNFEDPLLNKSLGYLFTFEHISSVQITQNKYNNFPKALKIGVYVDEGGQGDNELEGLIEYLKQQLAIIEDIADQWFKIIQVLSNAKLKCLSSENSELKDEYQKTEKALNIRFQRFLDNTYWSLFSLSGVRNPVVVSRILEHMNAVPVKKKALLVIDGLNYWQWTILSKALTDASIGYSSSASLAFIPTITAWSRQAIFKGNKPDLTTDNSNERKLFEGFWTKQGIPRFQIAYTKFSV